MVVAMIFVLPFKGDLYLDIENSKVCELVSSVRDKSRMVKVTEKILSSDPERFARISVSYDGLDRMAERMAPVFDVIKGIELKDAASVIQASKGDKTEWMTYSMTYYVKSVLDDADLFIDYGYNEYNPTELTFRMLRNDPAALDAMLDQFRDKE